MVVEDADIARIEQSLLRLEQKIDNQSDKYLTRAEYEARHAALQLETAKVSHSLEAVESSIRSEIGAITLGMQKVSADKWKLIAVSLISVITSGTVVSILEYVHVFAGH